MTISILPGLCSITLRELTVENVISAAKEAGLQGIEWGADRHVTPGDLDAAAEVGRHCLDAGILCPSYGTYVMAGHSTQSEVAAACETAAALGATNVRVWAPFGVTPSSTRAERAGIGAALSEAADLAASRGLTMSLEFHPGTLTENAVSTLVLLAEVDRPNVFTYWQPDPALDDSAALSELSAVANDLSHLHVFSWGDGIHDRLALLDGEDIWRPALSTAHRAGRWKRDRFAFLEYVRDDSLDQLRRDASTLALWLNQLEQPDA